MTYWDFLFRIGLSGLLGFAVGLERQLTDHAAGIRVNVLLCIGATFFCVCPILMGSDQTFRVEAAIIQGVGFLCSGVIFKEGMSVRGINTATTLWCTAAIGVLSGTGLYFVAITSAALLILANIILRPMVKKIRPVASDAEVGRQYRISVTCQEEEEAQIRRLFLKDELLQGNDLVLLKLESVELAGRKKAVYAEFFGEG